LEEGSLSPEGFVRTLKSLLSNQALRKDLSEKIGVFMKRRGAENIISIINEIL
jgi:UDP-N-acetylglucosamine:LPS N-acetylglucosamine transferase